jgi:type II secretory pathway pseudopilin PulG
MAPRRVGQVVARLGEEEGYTLSELLVVLAMLTIVVSAVVGVFVSASNAEARANRRFQAQLQARLGLNKLRREVHCASTASVTTRGSGASQSQSLQLTLPSVSASGLSGTVACPTGVGQFTWFTAYCKPTAPSHSSSYDSRAYKGRWKLFRVSGAPTLAGSSPPASSADCSVSHAVPWADYLTTGLVFPSPTFTAATSTTYATLHVELPVNLNPTQVGTYDLIDDIVLRNSSRTS